MTIKHHFHYRYQTRRALTHSADCIPSTTAHHLRNNMLNPTYSLSNSWISI